MRGLKTLNGMKCGLFNLLLFFVPPGAAACRWPARGRADPGHVSHRELTVEAEREDKMENL